MEWGALGMIGLLPLERVIAMLVTGGVIGLVPLICGLIRGRKLLGLDGLWACVLGFLVFGWLFALPLCALFTILVFALSRNTHPRRRERPAARPDAACGPAGTEQPAPRRCPSCGCENPSGMAFCSGCGTRLR